MLGVRLWALGNKLVEKSVKRFIFAALNAQVAKLVDALCSGRSVRKDVLVRIQSWALKKWLPIGSHF